MTLPNRTILTFAGLGMLVACSKIPENPQAPPAKVNALSDIGADRFQLTPLPTMSDANISNAVALYDKQHDVICYIVTRNSPGIDCVKL